MKQITYNITENLHQIVFPNHRIKDRIELLLIILETIRCLLISKPRNEGDKNKPYLVLCVKDMRRMIFFDEKKYYSIACPFNIYIDNQNPVFCYNETIIDAKVISDLIYFFKSEDYYATSWEEFILSLVDDNDLSSLWPIVKHMMTYDIGYIRYDDDEDGFLRAQKGHKPKLHPRYHIDTNISNESTFKKGLCASIKDEEFIHLLDNTQDRWVLHKP